MHVCVYSRGTRWSSAAARKVRRGWRDKAWQAINHRNSIQKLEEMVSCNFGPEDYHVVLTLSDAYNTTDYRVLRSYWQHFMDRVRKARRRRGAAALRYIYVMEGLHGDKRLHIHALFPAMDGESWAELLSSWQYGTAVETPMKSWEHRHHIGRYLSKEPRKLGRLKVGQRIFNASRNCERPTKTSYAIPDKAQFQIPEGYEAVAESPIRNIYGSYDYFLLVRKGSQINVDEWINA